MYAMTTYYSPPAGTYAPGRAPRPTDEFPDDDWVETARLRRNYDLTDAQGRVICAEAGHLVCEGQHCGGSCACCEEDVNGDRFIVRTDKDGDTLCKDCRYETKTAAWNQ